MDGSDGGFGDAAFSTLDLGAKGRERKKRVKGGTRDGMDFREGRTCAVQFHFYQLGKFKVENSNRYTHKVRIVTANIWNIIGVDFGATQGTHPL